MSLQGSLRTMSFEDILQWIDRRFVCGTLTLERGSITRFFQFDSGYITNSGSNEPSEHLGQLLMNRGLVTEQQLAEAFEVQGDTGVLLGKILIMVGAVDEKQLAATLEEKVCDSLCDTLTWTEGSFRFEPASEEHPVSEYEISVNLGSAMEEGARRAEQWRGIRELIPEDDRVIEVVDPARLVHPGDTEERRAEIERMIGAIRKGLTLHQLVLELNGHRFRVARRVAQLIERGALRIATGTPATAAPAQGPGPEPGAGDPAGEARRKAAAGDRAGALELARRALDAEPDNSSLQTLHRELERALFAELSRRLLSSFRVPKLLKSPEELALLELTDNERYIAGRIDGRWDLLSLMRISPLREVEALITFKRLADRGIISL
jgi:hypothetical protein